MIIKDGEWNQTKNKKKKEEKETRSLYDAHKKSKQQNCRLKHVAINVSVSIKKFYFFLFFFLLSFSATVVQVLWPP